MYKPWLVPLVGLIVLAFAQTICAGPEVLDTLIDRALKNHPDLAAAASYRDAAFNSAEAAGALPDPMLSLGVMNLPTNTLALDETPMSAVTVGFDQKIPWPGKLRAESNLAEVEYRRSQTTIDAVRNRITREVTDAFFEYSFWAMSRSIIEDYLGLLKATWDVADVRYANGEASAQDVLRAGSMLSRAEVRLLKADRMLSSARLRLWRAVGDSALLAELSPYLPEPNPIHPFDQTVESNPTLKDAELLVEESSARIHRARSDYWPDFSLGVGYSIREDVIGDPVRGTDFLSFKVGLNIPLWFFAKQKHSVRAAQNRFQASREQKRSIRDLLTTRLKDTQSNLQFTLESIDRYDQSIVPQAEAALQAAQVAYEVGQIDFNALLAAQSDLLDIRLERLELVREYGQTQAVLMELIGKHSER